MANVTQLQTDKNMSMWQPHRPARPEKSEGGKRFRLESEFEPKGDQPAAIKELCEGLNSIERDQVLLGVTGSGKTFTMAKIIEQTQRPALIMAPTRPSQRSFTRNLRASSPIMPWNISSLIMIIISPRPMCRAPIPSLRKTVR